MRNSAKLLAAVAVAGLTFAAGSAFTGTGVTNNAGATQFIGGTVTQTVTGATLSTVGYGFTDATKTAVNKVTLTFADATGGKTPSIELNGAANGFTCEPVTQNVDNGAFESTCAGPALTGLSSIAVTVS
ncbi:hypothetical protein [Arthrobacter mobilis]|uniref:Neocarzinostatin family protein n=1 Tax=Arthrobacter mobilis TaxID=2724944 RepID=A0A7X6HEB7_9MICC|nr:hypothetical protein [Arthrobacter mobilis]NKX55426.1 hypothetical protein [Arthrobacter mobilis]